MFMVIVLSASSNTDKDGELLTLDAIRSGIRFQKSVAEGWLKVNNVGSNFLKWSLFFIK